jgi:hypothetical protein
MTPSVSVTIGRNCVIPLDPQTLEPMLLQTWWYEDAWRVCVTSLLLVATQRAQVEPMLEGFYGDYPDARSLLMRMPDSPPPDAITGLGLADQRTDRLIGFSADYLLDRPVRECFGVGPYVEQAYRLVHLKDDTTETDDIALTLYRSWLRSLPEDPLRWAR